MEVMGSRGDGEQVPGGAGAELGQCRFCTLTWPELVTGRISEAGKGLPLQWEEMRSGIAQGQATGQGHRGNCSHVCKQPVSLTLQHGTLEATL